MFSNDIRPSRFEVLPAVVKNILIINIIMFLATFVFANTLNIDLVDRLGLHFPLAEKFKPVQVITYMFMHGSFAHIFFNMFALWMFGNVLENYWGPKRFLIYYLVTGIGAAAIHYTVHYFEIQPTLQYVNQYLANPSIEGIETFFKSNYLKIGSEEMRTSAKAFVDQYNNLEVAGNKEGMLALSTDFMLNYKKEFLNAPVVVGASGAVFGILLAFGMLFPNTLLYVYFAIPIKAKYFVILYGAIELFYGIANRTGDNVAHFAHLGGMLFGFLLIRYWKKRPPLY